MCVGRVAGSTQMMSSDVMVSPLPQPTLMTGDASHRRHGDDDASHHGRHGGRRPAPVHSSCLVLLSSVSAHQQAINVMRCHGDRVVTASNDHTLKVCSSCDECAVCTSFVVIIDSGRRSLCKVSCS